MSDRRKTGPWRVGWLLLAAGIPFLAGGCTDVRNGFLDALQAATITAFSDTSTPDAATTFQNSLVQSLVTTFYNHLRIQQATTP